VILALACLGHVGLILLLAGGVQGVRVPAREAEPLLLTLLDSLVRPEPRPAEVPAPVLTPPSEVFAGPLPEIDSSGPAYAPPVSDSVPDIDWIDERRREVANVLARDRGEAIRFAKNRCDPAAADRVRAPRSCNRAGAGSQVDR
jgi:hypothetical protein